MTTSLLWNSHASVIIRSGDDLFITDPWYGVAFSSWTPHPPPAVNAAMLVGLARAKRLKVIVSHAHDDHLDPALLRSLEGAEIYGPASLVKHLPGITAITGPTRAGGCTLNSWDATHSAVISVEAPDCTILHGNDVYALPAKTVAEMRAYLDEEPVPRLYMGQGGSASGWPLRYRYSPRERAAKAHGKQVRITAALYDLASQLGSNRILAYACFARAEADGQEWFPLDSSGRRANEFNGTDKFLEMEPGDVYLPADDRVVKILPSLNVRTYPHPPMPVFADVWDIMAPRMHEFMAGIDPIAEKHGLDFSFDVQGVGRYACGHSAAARHKVCHVSRAIMSNVLAGKIPMTDLSTGYLAEWSREPDEPNIEFLTDLEDYGYTWMERTAEPRDV